MAMTTPTDITEFLQELDAGVFAEKVGHELSQIAMAVVEHGRPGRLQVTLDFKQIGHHHQLTVKHTMTSTRPTLRGKKTEEDATDTPMHVGRGGKMTFFPDTQMDLIPKEPKPARQAEE
jgi:hypothetical protein